MLRGTLKKADPKSLRDNGMHPFFGMQKRLKDKMTSKTALKGSLQHANKSISLKKKILWPPEQVNLDY